MKQARTARWLTCVTAIGAALTLALAGRVDAQDPVVTINGFAVVGETLTAVVEPADPDAEFQWLRCSAEGDPNCDKISGATGASYVVTAVDLGHRLAVRLKGGDPDRDFTAVVTQSEPASVSSVVIAGEPELHKTLTASATTSGNPPPTVRFQWLRCSGDPLPCNSIDGATRASYEVVGADVGKPLAVSATATNSSGVDTRQSDPTSPVQAPPRVTSVGISGQALIGDRLTATATATGFPAPTLDYSWLRCPVDPETDCQPIADATDPSYVVEAVDAAHTLVARAIAINPGRGRGEV